MSENALGKATDDSTDSDKDSSVECPTCGKTDFKNEGGMRIHHYQSHGEKLSETVECEVCGVEEQLPPSQVEYYTTCSIECRSELQSELYSGDGNPNYSGGDVTVVCEWCSEEYETNKADVENSRFCSRECVSDWISENNYGENHPLWSRVSVECAECGVQMHRKKNEYESFENLFCSEGCRSNYYGRVFKGEDHPNWNPNSVDSGFYSTRKWKETRKKVLEEDGYECKGCGATGVKLHVHHIVPRSAGGSDYDLDNLVPFCMSCHNRWEGLYLRPDPR